jgi:hypothetical protein
VVRRRGERGRDSLPPGPSEARPAAKAGEPPAREPLESSAPVTTPPWRGRRWARIVVAVLVCTLAVFAGVSLYLSKRPRFDMVATLATLVQDEGAWDNPWDVQPKKIAELQQGLQRNTDPVKRLIIRRELANQYVYGGASEPGIGMLESLISDYRRSLAPSDLETLKADLALAYFRLGELQNCTWNHNSDSCIFPIKPDGVHKEQLGASEAAKRYSELLADPATNPENALVYRWLLNVSYMVLGKYPDGVPKAWLIPPSAFQSDYDIGLFRDVAVSRGASVFGRAGGVIMEDFDNDGYLDLMISHMGIEEQMEYLHNNGDGTFTRKTDQAGLKGMTGGLNMVQADFDNDGCIDVYVMRGAWLHDHGQYPSSLLHNNCDGTFTDVSAKAGVMNNYPTQTAVWADFNNDGLLDLFVGNEIVRDKVDWPADAKNFRLYINNGDGTFTDVGPETGIAVTGMVKGATADDYDNDGWPDLYVSVMGGGTRNHLFRNLGQKGKVPHFVDVTAQAGVAEPDMSFTTWFFDYNNDGRPDIFVSGYWATIPNIVREYIGEKDKAVGNRPRLYRNNGDGTFTDVSREVGLDHLLLTMGANFGDLDNDGWLDFYLGTGAAPLTNIVPHQMFRNDRGQRFQNVTTSGGFGHLQKGHAVAFGDIDNNGNQDVFEQIGGAFTADKFWTVLFKNPGHGNHWIKLRLTGTRANRLGVGARIRVEVSEDSKPREIYRSVNSGGSFGSSSLRPHIGIGPAEVVNELEVRWPGSGTVQRFKGPIAADRTYEVKEGDPELHLFTPRPAHSGGGPGRLVQSSAGDLAPAPGGRN